MLDIPTVRLGKTGLKVSKLGFGTFDFGVPSVRIGPKKGGQILARARKLGVSFWDTSEDYGSHPHIASALDSVPREDVVICTKTNATSNLGARRSLKNSLHELGTSYVDILLLHYVRSDWIDGCSRLLRRLQHLKESGSVRAVGISTHSVAVAREAAEFDELDVVMAICCKADQATLSKFRDRIPLEDGTMDGMYRALRLAHDNGKGVIAMKVLGDAAPPLVGNYWSSIRAVARLRFVDTLVVGMKSLTQVRKNIKALQAKSSGT